MDAKAENQRDGAELKRLTSERYHMPFGFRHTAGFGRRMEYWIIGKMLKEGIDVYVPLVDDNGIDAVIRKADGKFVTVQIKARSKDVKLGDGALFAAISHDELRLDYYFIFYAERLDLTWIMTSKQLIKMASQNKNGKNAGLRSIWFNGFHKDPATGERVEYCKPQYEEFLATDFTVFR